MEEALLQQLAQGADDALGGEGRDRYGNGEGGKGVGETRRRGEKREGCGEGDVDSQMGWLPNWAHDMPCPLPSPWNSSTIPPPFMLSHALTRSTMYWMSRLALRRPAASVSLMPSIHCRNAHKKQRGDGRTGGERGIVREGEEKCGP